MAGLLRWLNMLALTCKLIALAMLTAGAAGMIGLYAQGYNLLNVTVPALGFQPGDALIVAPTGQPTAILPKFGCILTVLSNPLGLGILVFLPATAILAFEIRRLSRSWSRIAYSLQQ